MFVEMTVIVIAIDPVVKRLRTGNDMTNGLAYAQYLQGLFAAEAGTGFKITLECAGGNMVLQGQLFHRCMKTVIDHRFL